jgi:hypothetical protein
VTNGSTLVFRLPGLYDIASPAKARRPHSEPSSNPCWTPIPMLVDCPIEPYIVFISGQRMAQTRRMGKRNRRADRPKAPRFSPYRNGLITPTDLVALSPRLLKLTRMSGRRITATSFKTHSLQGYCIQVGQLLSNRESILRYKIPSPAAL